MSNCAYANQTISTVIYIDFFNLPIFVKSSIVNTIRSEIAFLRQIIKKNHTDNETRRGKIRQLQKAQHKETERRRKKN